MLEFKLNNLPKNNVKFIPVGSIFSFLFFISLYYNIDLHFNNILNSMYLCDVIVIICGCLYH